MRFNMTQQHVGLELDACASSINELDAKNWFTTCILLLI
jgi:hypothetical protein